MDKKDNTDLKEFSLEDEDFKDPIIPTEESEEDSKGESEEIKEEPEFDQAELMAIFDDIIFNGEYVEETTIRGKLKVKFRSRTTKEASSIARNVDAAGFKMMATLEQYVAMMNLAYSLIEYNGKDLSSRPALSNDKDVKSRHDFINDLPGVVTAALYTALSNFDRKVHFACVEGAENF